MKRYLKAKREAGEGGGGGGEGVRAKAVGY